MKKKQIVGLLLVLSLSVTTAGTSVLPAYAQVLNGSTKGTEMELADGRTEDLTDMSLSAAVSSDYTASWENLDGIKTDWEPQASSGQETKGWGNWGVDKEKNPVNYVQYDWDAAITTSQMQIYWYDDGGGTRVPATFEIQYKNGEGEWQTANMTTDFAAAQALNQYNTIEFDEIKATSIKLLMTLQEGAGGTGIYRWKVFADNSKLTEDDKLKMDLDLLTIPAKAAAEQIDLVSVSKNGYVVSWESDNSAIKIEDGKGIISRGATTAIVNLTGTITGTETDTNTGELKSVNKTFQVIVPAAHNAATNATVTASYNGYNDTLPQINDENDDNFWNGWGGGDKSNDPWIQYDFDEVYEITESVIRWYDDSGGVVVPQGIVLQYYDEISQEWKNVTPTGENWVYTKGTDNIYKFERIATNKLKLLITNSLNDNGDKVPVAIHEWSVPGSKLELTAADLQQAINDAQAYEKDQYTQATFRVLEEALMAAQESVTNENLTVMQIDHLIQNLQKAIDGLVKDVVEPGPGNANKTVLANLIGDAGKMTAADYTTESWSSLSKALTAAIQMNDNAEATQEQVDAAVKTLQDAISGLIRKGSAEELQAELQKLSVPEKVFADEIDLTSQSESGYTVKWQSDKDAIKIENGKGIVTRGAEEVTVKLTATITVNAGSDSAVTENREFSVVVPAVYLAKSAAVTASYSYGESLKLINDEDKSTFWNGWSLNQEDFLNPWIQYEFADKLELTGGIINWKDDGAGVIVPESITFQYFDESSQDWKEVVKTGDDWLYVKDVDNTYQFEKVITKKIKLIINNGSLENNKVAAAINEWNVIGTAYANPDLTKLNEDIAAAKAAYDGKEAEYTQTSFAAYKAALQAAEQTAAHANPTKEQIDQAIADLKEAIEGLQKVVKPGPGTVDKTELANVIGEATKKSQQDYTKESWEKLTTALNAANQINEDENATKEQIEQAVKDLQQAIEGLVKKDSVEKVDFSALNQTIESAKKYKADKYTVESFKVFRSALSDAKKVAKNTKATQKQVDDANSKLKKAIKNLIKLKIVSTKKASLGVGEKYSVKTKGGTYTTSQKKVASVTSKGVVTAKKVGKATIKATNKAGKVKVYNITVKKAPKKIVKVTPAKKTLKKGKKVTLKVTLPKGSAGKVTFKSNKPKVAAVTSKGVVTAKKKGTAKITVKTYNNKKKTVTIKVK